MEREKVKEEIRKQQLIKKGYFTVNKLIEELQKIKIAGHGDELIMNNYEHISGCEFDKILNCVVVY